jgi:hypothetical protein
MVQNPWSGRQIGLNADWFTQDDRQRFAAWNASAKPDKQVLLQTSTGPAIPSAWAGDPWNASVIILLKNPAFGPNSNLPNGPLNDQLTRRYMEEMAVGKFDPAFPNAGLRPNFQPLRGRKPTRGKALAAWNAAGGREQCNWHAGIVWKDIHKELVGMGMAPQEAWKRISQRGCTLDLSPWGSASWTPSCMSSVSYDVCVPLAREAHRQGKVVIVAWGADLWQVAGFYQAGNLESSAMKGVRHTPRINKNNFPKTWPAVMQAMV